MKPILLQKTTKWGNDILVPFDPESVEAVKELKPNQPIECKVNELGAKKSRSVAQFNLFHAALRVVSHNTFDRNWNTLSKAKFSLKIELEYFDRDSAIVRPDGTVILGVRSFAFKALPHMEANGVFDRSWPILAGVIGVSVGEILRAAQNREY